MALLCNGRMFVGAGVASFGATAHLSTFAHTLPRGFTNRIRNITAGEGITDDKVGLPSGYRHPQGWMMPQKAGAIAARNTLTGSGATSATGQSGYNIDATITGEGDIPPTSLGLIVQIAAMLTASGTISSASANALASMVADITGSGDVVATAAGLADLGATLLASGSISANNTALMDISSNIRGYGDLTPEGIRDLVWTAILANYPDTGTAGNSLALASSGGVDYTALGAAVWASVTRTLTSDAAPTTADIVAAIEVAIVPVNIVKVNSVSVDGVGTELDPWGPV